MRSNASASRPQLAGGEHEADTRSMYAPAASSKPAATVLRVLIDAKRAELRALEKALAVEVEADRTAAETTLARPTPSGVGEADVDALAAMGVRLGAIAGGRR